MRRRNARLNAPRAAGTPMIALARPTIPRLRGQWHSLASVSGGCELTPAVHRRATRRGAFRRGDAGARDVASEVARRYGPLPQQLATSRCQMPTRRFSRDGPIARPTPVGSQRTLAVIRSGSPRRPASFSATIDRAMFASCAWQAVVRSADTQSPGAAADRASSPTPVARDHRLVRGRPIPDRTKQAVNTSTSPKTPQEIAQVWGRSR